MYDVRPVDLSEEGIAECVNMLNIAFPSGKHLTNEYLDWEYNRNPTGGLLGYNAYFKGELVAHYIAQPIVAKLAGKHAKGLLAINSATHPEHQGNRLYTTLADRTYIPAKEQGYEFVIAVANANSTSACVKWLGFRLVSPLVAKVGIGPILRRLPIGEIEYERTWTPESLRWRMANPTTRYSVTKKRGKFYVEAPTRRLGIHAILGEFDNEMYDQYPVAASGIRYNPLRLWIGLDESVNWSRCMFFDIPKRLRPSPLNLIFKDLTENNTRLSREKVRFQLIDFDAY